MFAINNNNKIEISRKNSYLNKSFNLLSLKLLKLQKTLIISIRLQKRILNMIE